MRAASVVARELTGACLAFAAGAYMGGSVARPLLMAAGLYVLAVALRYRAEAPPK